MIGRIICESNPLVSVIVLVGPNSADSEGKSQLFASLGAIINSSYKNLEIIVTDNNCPQDLDREIQRSFPQIRIFRLPVNTGIFAYGVGFANAKGKYFLALDDDCVIERETIGKIVDCFEKNSQNIGAICLNIYDKIEKYYFFDQYLKLSLNDVFTFSAGGVAFRREVFEKIGYYDQDFFCWGQDDDYAIRMIQAGYQIHFDENIRLNHYGRKAMAVRTKKIFLMLRNRAWFNLKNISWRYFPLFIARDLTWFILYYFRGSPKAIFWGILGYLSGYFLFLTPLSKRKPVSFKIQKRLINYYLNFWRHNGLIYKFAP